MSLNVRLAQLYNRFWPVHHYKPRVARWAEGGIPHDTAVHPNLYGWMKLELDTSIQWHRQVLLYAYEITTLNLLRRLLRPGDTFVDGGANLGLFTLVAARAVGQQGRVYAFEPDPTVFQRCQRNVQHNDMEHVELHELALWDESSERNLHRFGQDRDGRQSLAEAPDLATEATAVIRTARLDQIVSGPVRLIKLDIEGAEWPALRGASGLFAERWPHLILELDRGHDEAMGYSPIELLDWLDREFPGYRVYLLRPRKIEQTSRDVLARRIESEPMFHRNVWLQPPSAR